MNASFNKPFLRILPEYLETNSNIDLIQIFKYGKNVSLALDVTKKS